MINFRAVPLCTFVICGALASPALAQTILSGDHEIDGDLVVSSGANSGDLYVENNTILDGRVCIGNTCSVGETFANSDTLRLEYVAMSIQFNDTSSVSNPNRDWRIRPNDEASFASGGLERFMIQDDTAGTTPFSIEGGAPENALWVDNTGRIGVGTMAPQSEMHLVGPNFPSLRLTQDTSGANPAAEWRMQGNHNEFSIIESAAAFSIEAGAPFAALRIQNDGDLGVGINAPQAPLHVRRDSTGTAPNFAAGILVEDVGTVAPRGLMTLRNQGQVFFTLEDTSIPAGDNSGRAWNFQNLGGQFRVTTAPGGGDDIEMRLTTGGDMIIEGNYFAASGTELNVPDYVFADDYDLKPLAEVQAFIDTHSHLPGVPSAADINETGLNMTDMQMRLLKKVEELTLYTLEQEARLADVDALRAKLAAQDDELATLRGLSARLEALERAEATR